MALSAGERELVTARAAQFTSAEVVDMIDAVAGIFHIDAAAIRGRDRHGPQAEARQVVYYLLYERGWTLHAIALQMGRDHSTVHHGIRRITNSREALGEAKTIAKQLRTA